MLLIIFRLNRSGWIKQEYAKTGKVEPFMGIKILGQQGGYFQCSSVKASKIDILLRCCKGKTTGVLSLFQLCLQRKKKDLSSTGNKIVHERKRSGASYRLDYPWVWHW